MIKPNKLKRGDKVATITLSWGGAGDIPYRYEIGKKQIQENFGLEVVETTNALKSSDWIYKNPKARAEDLMEALEDKSIKAIISNIGGDDSIRLLKYIDLNIIKENPKIFIGFSDTTIIHFCFYRAGVTSFYGTSTLVGFAENNGMHEYQIADIKNMLFSFTERREIKPNRLGWTSEILDWSNHNNQLRSRKLEKNTGWRFLQGSGVVKGKLLGGCLEVLENLKGTEYWVQSNGWEGKIMFIEVSDFMIDPEYFLWIFRNYAASGILRKINGLILGRPYHNKYWKEYDEAIIKVLKEEELIDLPTPLDKMKKKRKIGRSLSRPKPKTCRHLRF
jgi:muramoyltetrapeptide carboxypeptidase LdcA involved in peptidoglycan recycling